MESKLEIDDFRGLGAGGTQDLRRGNGDSPVNVVSPVSAQDLSRGAQRGDKLEGRPLPAKLVSKQGPKKQMKYEVGLPNAMLTTDIMNRKNFKLDDGKLEEDDPTMEPRLAQSVRERAKFNETTQPNDSVESSSKTKNNVEIQLKGGSKMKMSNLSRKVNTTVAVPKEQTIYDKNEEQRNQQLRMMQPPFKPLVEKHMSQMGAKTFLEKVAEDRKKFEHDSSLSTQDIERKIEMLQLQQQLSLQPFGAMVLRPSFPNQNSSTVLSKEDKVIANETAKFKFNMNYGPQNQKSISSSAGAGNLQNSPQKIKAMQLNQSIVSLNGGKMPSVFESSRLISQAVLKDQSQSQLDMQIKSSKAFDVNQHMTLLEIIQKVEKSAQWKQKMDQEKRANDERFNKGKAKSRTSKQAAAKAVGGSIDPGRGTRSRLQANSSLEHSTEKINGINITSTFKPKIFAKADQKPFKEPLRSRSTIQGAKLTEAKLKSFNMLNKGRLPSISKQSATIQNNGVNSYNYLKSQWLDIKIQTKDRRRFVRDFAKRQLEPSPVNVALASTAGMDQTFMNAGPKRLSHVPSSSMHLDDGFQAIDDGYDGSRTHRKAVKVNIDASHVKPQILRGFDNNRQLLTDMRMVEKQKLQDQKDVKSRMLDSSLVFPEIKSDLKGRKKSTYQELQQYFNRPRVSTRSIENSHGFVKINKKVTQQSKNNTRQNSRDSDYASEYEEVHQDLVGPKINGENLDKVYQHENLSQTNQIRRFAGKFHSQLSPQGSKVQNGMIKDHELSPELVREQNMKKYNHLKILGIKEQLQELLVQHLSQTPKYNFLSRGTQSDFQITRFEVQYLFDLDAMDYRQGRNSQLLRDSHDDSLERTTSVGGRNSKDNLHRKTGKNKKMRILALLPTSAGKQRGFESLDQDDRNFIQESLEELPEAQLLKLVEILFEEPRGQINIYRNIQKRESRIGQYLGIESIQNQNSLSQIDVNQNSQLYIGESNANITSNLMESQGNLMSSQMMGPVQLKIDAYQNKIQLNVQKSKDSLGDLGVMFANKRSKDRSLISTKNHTFNPGFDIYQQPDDIDGAAQVDLQEQQPNTQQLNRIGSLESILQVPDDPRILDEDDNEYGRDAPSMELSSLPKDSSMSSQQNQRHFTERRQKPKKSPFKVTEQPPVQTPHLNILNSISFNNRQVFSPALSPYQVSENDWKQKYDQQDLQLEEAKEKEGTSPAPLLDKRSFWEKIGKINEIKQKEQKLVIYKSILGINEWYQLDGQFTPQYQSKTLTNDQLIEQQMRQYAQMENKSVSDVLKRINEQVIDIRQMISPIFSGNLGENVKKNSENLMLLFKNLPPSDQLYKQRIDEETEEMTKSLDFDVFDEDKKSLLDEMKEEFKAKTSPEVDRSSSSGNNSPKAMIRSPNQASRLSLIMSESGGPENEQQQRQMKRFIAQMQNLTVKEMDFYNLMVKMYDGNREIQKEFEKMRYQNRVKIDFKNFNLDQKRQQFVNIDLQKMAQQYQSGTYYLMKVMNYKLQEMKLKAQIGLDTQRTVRFAHEKGGKQPANEKMLSKLRQTLAQQSPFSKVEEQQQIVEDSQYMLPVLLNNIDWATGQRPCSRKNFGCCWANGRMYILGGSAYTLLNDLKSFNFGTLSWRTEDRISLESPTTKHNKQKNVEKHRYAQDQKELENIQRRFGFSMCSYMDRFLVVFGGAGNYMSKLKRRETFNDLYMWDTHNSELYQQSLLKRATSNDNQEPSKWVDMNDQGVISPVSPKKFNVMYHARYDKTAYTGGMNRDIQDAGPPTRRCYHAADVYGGCLVIQGGVYSEDNRVLDDFALFDIALGMWIPCKQPKLNKAAGQLGPRSYHTMTAVQDPSVPLSKRNTRLMWLHEPSVLSEGAVDSKQKKRPTFFAASGIFVFGGLKGHLTVTDMRTMAQKKATRKPQNDLYLIKPCYRRNQKYLTRESAHYKKGLASKICFEVHKLSPAGKPPLPRYAHAACFIKNYLVIHGGRNDEIYTSLGNVALNDLHLYDVNLNQWLAVAIYSYVPISRWGHKIQAEQTAQQDYQGSRLVIFGGINLKSFCDTSLHEISFDSLRLMDFIDQNEKNISQLIKEGQRQLRDIDARV